jgi:hypothetical protein
MEVSQRKPLEHARRAKTSKQSVAGTVVKSVSVVRDKQSRWGW